MNTYVRTTQLVFVLTIYCLQIFIITYVQIWSLDCPEPEYYLPTRTDISVIRSLEFFTRYDRQYLVIVADEDHKAHVCIFIQKRTYIKLVPTYGLSIAVLILFICVKSSGMGLAAAQICF
jgi:hypothetical protein